MLCVTDQYAHAHTVRRYVKEMEWFKEREARVMKDVRGQGVLCDVLQPIARRFRGGRWARACTRRAGCHPPSA